MWIWGGLIAVLALGAVWAARRRARTRDRKALMQAPLTEAERAIVLREVPLVAKLPENLRGALEGKINAFLDQVAFVGCNGLEVTDEMRLSIAAQACFLIVNTETWYRNLTTILVYPGAFKSKQARRNGYVVTEAEITRSGESWSRGPVVLSWAHTQAGARDDSDGHNVVFHEFAHRIDDLSGHTDGMPVLNKDQSEARWARVFVGAFERHDAAVSAGRRTVIDPYGAEGHEEFFAVAVEAFFETPGALKGAEPEVYRELAELFRLDPGAWDQIARD